ncbi:hypothetical protein BDV95DRAFT_622661 [Massariosphaeria phaeospora]|uniref:MYND-type domain-containing protein n=1 Tax=Massariosphaeria phaeospora TaxID=100035 RepID=A0A7C8I8I8_9PLEO|nr:hypothetical protein BDV95DRAFT_622661 [Massariosphaeria phaeospora]
MSEISATPGLCANTCQKDHAPLTCGGCYMVQYCSKECQVADWPRHKDTCKSAFMKGIWQPEWYRTSGKPDFIGNGPPITTFGTKKYLWGNMPAIDILQLNENETDAATVVGLPDGYKGECVVVLNDREFVVAARNAIMLLIMLHFEPDTAV